ncbi:nucleoside triphosphate pyrophosphohydrolase [Alkalicoccus daliensis]|uniref:Tetrapyrrole methylase family protein / MazG family protein n=1 Tax=Alkalicoccus daliensis TaxID=745820 RepID=A0A1H0KVF8_9BACI|nr:nucleoside triphosphate pyrophosphohydrolase [Alkalicoccus daliensis]SDO59772.1 tetrapyrrole methylase family protein / MazG family protein [Alkalicoccus daliensis]
MTNSHIRIVGLGAGEMDQLPLGIYKRLLQEKEVLIRTKDHPLVSDLEQEGVVFHSFDALYENTEHFEQVYIQIAEEVLAQAREKGEVTYAVPGHPLVAEMTVQLLLHQPEIPVTVEGGQSFLDAMFTALQIDPNDGFQLVDGTAMHPEDLMLTQHIIVSQVFDEMSAAQVKIGLMERYPDSYPVTVVTAAGTSEEKLLTVPLFEVDRVAALSNLTALYLAPVQEEQLLYREFSSLRQVIRTLRGPDGCPWDKKQTHQSLKRYAVEEVYELLEAIDEEDDDHIVEELGDVLLQVMLHAQIGEDEGYFDVADVIEHVTEKMIRRHPHVFGETDAEDAEEVLANWEEIKKSEKQGESRESELDGIPKALPALLQAAKLQKKAARVGFDWGEAAPMWAKVEEEISEWKQELTAGNEAAAVEELGDVLFAFVNIARFYKIDPEEALQQTNRKFSRRFRHIETRLQEENRSINEESLAALDELWEEAKKIERKG